MLECEAPSVEPAEDTVMTTLLDTSEIPPPPPQENAKRRRVREEDEARAWKKERREMEVVMRSSLADEEVRQMRVVELAAGESSYRNVEIAGDTNDSVVDVVDTTEVFEITEVVGFGEPDAPA